ncbi:MAG: hypothetical protein NTV00_05695 [Methylococcales bacterium]|nr:hypothetical protein [Methylococcales bacterium]
MISFYYNQLLFGVILAAIVGRLFFVYRINEGLLMAQVIEETVSPVNRNGYLLLGAGLAVASMIVIPALAMRIVLMKASSRATAVACRVPVCDSSDITCQ